MAAIGQNHPKSDQPEFYKCQTFCNRTKLFMIPASGMFQNDSYEGACGICYQLGAKIGHQNAGKVQFTDNLVHMVHIKCFEKHVRKQIAKGLEASCSICDVQILNNKTFSMSSIEKQVLRSIARQRVAERAFGLLVTTITTTSIILAGRVGADSMEMRAKGALGKITSFFTWMIQVLAMPLSLAGGLVAGMGVAAYVGRGHPLLRLSGKDREKRIQLLMDAAAVLMWINSIAAHILKEEASVLFGAAVFQAVCGSIASEYGNDFY